MGVGLALCAALAACAAEPSDLAPWEEPVEGALTVTVWGDNGTPTAPFGPGGYPWTSPQQLVESMIQGLAQGDARSSGRVVEERADGSVIGWVRIVLDDGPVIGADLLLVMRRDADTATWSVVTSSRREHCTRPLDDGECR